jgi:GntR family transcriptional regulator/MocR family aminotransferase
MTEGLDLHLGVDKEAGFVGRALETALREAIRSGRLHAGARLPGSRSLAVDLGISRGTVVQAYAQLIAEGWLTGTTGSGTRVADLPAWPAAGGGEDPAPTAARLAVDLRPGRPDLSSFPRTDWASSVRRALSAAAYEDLDYAEPAGLPVLRAAVAGYVTRARGVRAGTRRGPARRADHRVRHSPAARLVPGAGGTGRSGTGNLSLSGLRYWTGRHLAWWA